MSASKHIVVLPGDGIGPEITNQSLRVLDAVSKKFGHDFQYSFGLIGADAIDKTGDPLPQQTIDLCKNADAILFGAVGDPKYDQDHHAHIRPEQGLMRIRRELGLFANIRHIVSHPSVSHLSPVRPDLLEGVNIVIFRELTGGLYMGERHVSEDGKTATDTSTYTEQEINRIATYAFQLAQKRKRKVTLIDRANVLETSRLWRRSVHSMSSSYPEVELEFMYVDTAASQLITNPSRFDVILTENLFGDILSHEAAVLSGSPALIPSASIGNNTAFFEPIHGSYSAAKGKDIANPLGSILSAAGMLEYLELYAESAAIKHAVKWTLENGFVTKDIDPINFYFTSTIGEMISDRILQASSDPLIWENILMRKSTII
jgi:3-isopropylmalate dehydrogenase